MAEMNLNFGDTLAKRVGRWDFVGKFVGMHKVNAHYTPIMCKGRVIGKCFVPTHETPVIQPFYMRPHDFNTKYPKPHQGKKECARRLRTHCDSTQPMTEQPGAAFGVA